MKEDKTQPDKPISKYFQNTAAPLRYEDFFIDGPKPEFHLQIPPKEDFASQYKDFTKTSYYSPSYSKEWFQKWLDPLFNKLKGKKTSLIVHGTNEEIAPYVETFEKIVTHLNSMVKEYYVVFASLIYSDTINEFSYNHTLCNDEQARLIDEAVDTGGLNAKDLMERLGFKVSAGYYYSNKVHTYKTLYDNPRYRVFNRNIFIEEAISEKGVRRSYYSDVRDYFVPRWSAIAFSLVNKYKGIPGLLPADLPADTAPAWSFSCPAVIGAAMNIKGMVLGNILVNGKQKVSMAVIKKVTKKLNLPKMPLFGEFDKGDANEILTTLSALVDKIKFKADSIPETVMRLLFDSLCSLPEQMTTMLLSDSVRKLNARDLTAFNRRSRLLLWCIKSALKDMVSEKFWISRTALYDRIRFLAADAGLDYMTDSDRADRMFDVYDLDDELLTLYEGKTRLYDVTIHGILLSFAALGALELSAGDDGFVNAVRLTDLGRWYLDKNLESPLHYDEEDISDTFDVDDNLMIISARNPESPMISLLKEYTQHIGAARFHLTRKALMAGCDSEAKVKDRINLLKANVIGKPGPVISQFFKDVLGRCNLVNLTPGGTTYRLFDIDPQNKELRDLILSDSEIQQNSMRVEGCRLLVKNSYIDTFFAKLRSAGFPVDNV